MRRCFQPRAWFIHEGEPSQFDFGEEVLMWVYREGKDGQFDVGYFMPDGHWFGESSHASRASAAERVNYLNGGHSK